MKEIVISIIGVALGATFLLLGISYLVPSPFNDVGLGLVSVAGFSILFLPIFVRGYNLAKHDNKNHFTNHIILFILLKILLSFALIFVYYKINKPKAPEFLLSFFVVYIIYTTFGVYFLSKLGRTK